MGKGIQVSGWYNWTIFAIIQKVYSPGKDGEVVFRSFLYCSNFSGTITCNTPKVCSFKVYIAIIYSNERIYGGSDEC